jgi:hypothetical protein
MESQLYVFRPFPFYIGRLTLVRVCGGPQRDPGAGAANRFLIRLPLWHSPKLSEYFCQHTFFRALSFIITKQPQKLNPRLLNKL